MSSKIEGFARPFFVGLGEPPGQQKNARTRPNGETWPRLFSA